VSSTRAQDRNGNSPDRWFLLALFEPHHDLKLPRMVAADYDIGFVTGAPVTHIFFSPRRGLVEARA
jgi:hypothetical protein